LSPDLLQENLRANSVASSQHFKLITQEEAKRLSMFDSSKKSWKKQGIETPRFDKDSKKKSPQKTKIKRVSPLRVRVPKPESLATPLSAVTAYRTTQLI
jgi:hypothetical protein